MTEVVREFAPDNRFLQKRCHTRAETQINKDVSIHNGCTTTLLRLLLLLLLLPLLYPRETPLHTRTARAKPAAAHRRRYSRPHHHRHREHSYYWLYLFDYTYSLEMKEVVRELTPNNGFLQEGCDASAETTINKKS